jgi:hypothetical protein
VPRVLALKHAFPRDAWRSAALRTGVDEVDLIQQAGSTARDVVIAGHNLQLSFFHETGYYSGGFSQKRCLDLGIRLGCRLEIGARLIYRGLNMRKEGADLPGNFLRLNRSLHRSATAVPHHQDHLRA